MSYNINSVVIVDNNTNKTIIDKEFILNEWIYYMSDNTSYGHSQIKPLINTTPSCNKHHFSDEAIKAFFEWYKENKLKKEEPKKILQKSKLKRIISKYFPFLF